MIMKMFKILTTTRRKKRRSKFYLSKRRKFVLIAFLVAIGTLVIQSVPAANRYMYIGILTGLTAIFSAWSLKDDIRKVGWLMAIILPAFFTASINLFYFLLPTSIYVKMGLVVLFMIGMYAILLTENIFVVASIRTIQLFRAAQALGFVFTLLVAFLVYDTIFSFRLDPWLNAPLVFAVSFPLLLQAVWSCKLEERLSVEVIEYTSALSWLLAILAFFISFWPVTITFASLFLVSIMYVVLGIVQQNIIGRLFRKTVFEYMRVGIVVMIIVFFAAKWGGN
jgi:hypothetical protein